MATAITASQGWTILSELASKVGANGTVSSSDVEELMKKADRNKDGKVTSDEFVFCYKTTDDYQEMEANYQNAFKVVAAFDQDANSISQEDILGILESIKSLDLDGLDAPANTNAGGGGNSGGGGLGSGDTPYSFDPAVPTTQALSFTGEESLEDLQTLRNDTLDQIDQFNQDKASIEQQPAVQKAQDNVNKSQEAYDASLEALANKEGQKSELEVSILAQKELKDANDKEISKQKDNISEIKNSLEKVETTINETQNSISAHQADKPLQSQYMKTVTSSYVDKNTGKTITTEEKVPDRDAFRGALSTWTTQLNQLNQALNTAKAEKANLTNDLNKANQQLDALNAKEVSIDNEIASLIADAKATDVEISKEVLNVSNNLQTHQQADYNLMKVEHETMAQIDAELQVLNENLLACTTQISEMKTNDRVNNLEDIASNPSKLEEIFNDPEISASEELYLFQVASVSNPDAVEKFLENNKEFLTGSVKELAKDYGITVDDMYKIALENSKTEIDQKMQDVENMRTGLGNQVSDFFSSLFGGGFGKEFSKVADAKQLYNEATINPTAENITSVLNALNGLGTDWNDIAAQVKMAKYLEQGGLTSPDGQPIDMQSINKMLEEGLTSLEADYKQTVEQAGVLSMLAGMVTDIGGIGTTSTMTREEMDRLKAVITKMSTTTDPLEYAALYKQATGQELTYGSISKIMSSENVGILDASRANESIMDYESNRDSVKAAGVAIVVGAVTGGMGVVPALALSAVGYAGANLLDTVTQNNGKSALENAGEYFTSGQFGNDLLIGLVNGASNKVGNIAGKALQSVGSTAASTVARQVGRVAANAVDGYVDGAISAGAEYAINTLHPVGLEEGEEKPEFKVDDLLSSMKSGGLTGAMMNVAIGGLKGEYKLENNPQLDTNVLKTLGISDSADALGLKPGESYKVMKNGEPVDFVAKIDGQDYNIRNENGKVQFVPAESTVKNVAASQFELNSSKIEQNNKLIADEQAVPAYEGQDVGLAYLEGQNDAFSDVNTKLNDGSFKTADDIKSQIEANNQKIEQNNKLIADEQGVPAYEGQEVGLAYLEGQNDALLDMNKSLEAELSNLEVKDGAEIKVESNAKVKSEVETKVDSDAETKVDADTDSKVKVDAETKVDADPDSKVKPEADTKLALESGEKVKVDTEGKVDAEPKVKAEAKVETDANINSGTVIDPSNGTIFVIDGKKISNFNGKNYIEVDGVWKEVPDLKLTVEQLSNLKKMNEFADAVNIEEYNKALAQYSTSSGILSEIEKVYKNLRFQDYSLEETFGSTLAKENFNIVSRQNANGIIVHPYQKASDGNYNWVARTKNKNIFDANIVDRFSLNVKAETGVIEELDRLMRDGVYFDSTGRKITINIDDNVVGDFYYKVPNRIDSWMHRQDPITVYCNGTASPELEKALTEISAKYQRGSLSVAEPDSKTPWIQKEHSPNSNEIKEFVMNAYNKYGEKVGRTLDNYFYRNGDYSASSGMMRAAQDVLASIDSLNDIGKKLQTDLNYRKMFNDATLKQVDIESSSTVKSTSSLGAEPQVKSDAQVKFEIEKASYEEFKAKYEKALADVQEFEDLVKSGASADVIKKKYRQLSKMYHSDLRQGMLELTDEQNALFGDGVMARISIINDVAKGRDDFSNPTFKDPIINKDIDNYFREQDAKFYASNDADVNKAANGSKLDSSIANKNADATNSKKAADNTNPDATTSGSNINKTTVDDNANSVSDNQEVTASKIKDSIQKLKDLIKNGADESQIKALYDKIQEYCKIPSFKELAVEAKNALKTAGVVKTVGAFSSLAYTLKEDLEVNRPEENLDLDVKVDKNSIKFATLDTTVSQNNGANGTNGLGAGTPVGANAPVGGNQNDNPHFPGIGEIDFSQPVDYQNLLSNENLIFQASPTYMTPIDENLQVVLEKSSNPNVEIIKEEPLVFHKLQNDNFDFDAISDEYSLNVVGSVDLIKDLEQLMTTGTYPIELNGVLLAIELDEMTKFVFSTIDDASKWNETDCPITLYFEGDINEETLTALEVISGKYARAEFLEGVGVDNDVPYMKKIENPTAEQMETLHLKALEIDDEFANSVLEQSANLVGMSGLQYLASLEIIEQFEQDVLNSF